MGKEKGNTILPMNIWLFGKGELADQSVSLDQKPWIVSFLAMHLIALLIDFLW
jgi:hypothetical protein